MFQRDSYNKYTNKRFFFAKKFLKCSLPLSVAKILQSLRPSVRLRPSITALIGNRDFNLPGPFLLLAAFPEWRSGPATDDAVGLGKSRFFSRLRLTASDSAGVL